MNKQSFPTRMVLLCTLLSSSCLLMICPDLSAQSAPPMKKAPTPVMVLESEIEFGLQKIGQLEEVRAEFFHSAKRLGQELVTLRKSAFEMGASPESFPEVMKTLQTQRIQLTIDIAGLDSRRDALSQMTDQAMAMNQNSSLMDLLKEKAALQQKDLETIKSLAAKGTVSSSEMRKAEMAILETKIRISQGQSPNADLDRLNSALLDVSLDRAEKMARLEQTRVLLTQMAKANEVLERNRTTQRQFESVNDLLHTAASKVAEERTNIRVLELKLERLKRDQN